MSRQRHGRLWLDMKLYEFFYDLGSQEGFRSHLPPNTARDGKNAGGDEKRLLATALRAGTARRIERATRDILDVRRTEDERRVSYAPRSCPRAMTATSPAVTIVADGRVDERETKTPAETRDARESASSDDNGGDAESESKSESESEFEDEDVDAVRATLDRQGLGDDDDVVVDDGRRTRHRQGAATLTHQAETPNSPRTDRSNRGRRQI